MSFTTIVGPQQFRVSYLCFQKFNSTKVLTQRAGTELPPTANDRGSNICAYEHLTEQWTKTV